MRRQQRIERHPFEKENYIMLLLTIRSFTKTIISNSFFAKLTHTICKSCPTDKCFQGCPLPELCDHMGELFSEAMHRISQQCLLESEDLTLKFIWHWAYMPCFLSQQLFLRKSALLQSWKMIYVVRKGWKPVAKLHFCSLILFTLLLLLELFCSYLIVGPYAAMRIRLAQLIITMMMTMMLIIIIMLKNRPCHPKKENKRTQTTATTKTLAREGWVVANEKAYLYVLLWFPVNSSGSTAEVFNFHTKNISLISYHLNNYLLRDLTPRYRYKGR